MEKEKKSIDKGRIVRVEASLKNIQNNYKRNFVAEHRLLDTHYERAIPRAIKDFLMSEDAGVLTIFSAPMRGLVEGEPEKVVEIAKERSGELRISISSEGGSK